jgi:hypothetical protein
MSLTRRQVLTRVGPTTLGALALPALLEYCQASQTSPGFVDSATHDFFATQSSQSARALDDPTADPHQPEFVFYDADSKQFLDLADLEKDSAELPKDGTYDVRVNVERIRPSKEDRAKFKKLKTGSLRVDVGQNHGSGNPGLALAWSALAALFPGSKGEIPGLSDLQFDPGTAWGTVTNVSLPKGSGFWSWNFFLHEKDTFWSKLIGTFRQVGPVVPLILGLPAIAVVGLTQLNKFMGEAVAQAQTDWLFKSAPLQVYATKEGKDQLVGEGLRLRTGTYFVLPRSELGAFGSNKKDLEVQRELLVPRGTDSTQAFKAADEVLPDVTYLTVSVKLATSSNNS